MKRWYKVIVSSKSIKFVGFFSLFLFTLTLSLRGYNFTLEAAIPPKKMSIDYKSGKVSAVLKGVQTKEVLEDIAQKTGIELVGLDKVTGTIEDLEFNDLSLEEAIRTLGENSILIFRKEGPQEEGMRIKKVIFLAQKEEEKQKPPTPLPPPPPIKRTPPTKPSTPPEPAVPPKPATPPARPTPPPRPIPPPTPRPTPPPRPTTPKPPAKPSVVPVPPPTTPKPKPVPPKKPIPAPVKPKPKPKTQDANLKKGLKYYKEKRWDRAIKYLKIYSEKNPGDKEIQQKIALSKKNTKEAISIYKSGKNSEKAGNYEEAYKRYKKAYQLYPLLYDTWEKMREMKKKIK